MEGILRGAGALVLAVLVSLGGIVSLVHAQMDQTQSQVQGDPAASQSQSDQSVAQAQEDQTEQGKAEKNRVFQLGEVEVVRKEEENKNTTVERIYFDEMHLFNRDNVADAVNLLPGVTLYQMGPRNEQDVYIRGFDIKHVPIFLDGIPIYVPYDGYPDLARFKTFSLSEITVSKGFTSVLYGPNTMGGAINMITRRPEKEFEVDSGTGYGSGNAYNAFGNFGSNQGKWYIQGGASYVSSDYFDLSSGFTPTKMQGAGARDNSYQLDLQGNLKLGLTPNATDEYAISFMDQHAEKGVPPYTGTDPNDMVRYWKWPYWDVEGVHFNSNTSVCDKSYVKTTAFYDTFDNAIYSYDNGTYTTITKPYAFESFYADSTWGGSVEAGTKELNNNFIKAAFHFKDDVHTQWETIPVQPLQRFEDHNYSVALEDTIDFTSRIYSIVGISYDRVDTIEAQNLLQNNKLVSFQLGSADAWNPQGGIFYKLTDTGTIHFTVAEKSRLPGIKDKFSYRLNQALPNPDLKPEYATNYEFGYKDVLFKKITVEANAFYSDVSNYILLVNTAIPDPYYPGRVYQQNQNVGNVNFYGVELAVSGQILPCLKGGINYTYLQYENESNSLLLTDLPHDKVFAYLQYFTPIKGLSLLTSVEYNGARNSDANYAPSVAEAYTLINIQAVYAVYKGLTIQAGINNLTDENWSLTEGFPLAGRTYFVNMRYKF